MIESSQRPSFPTRPDWRLPRPEKLPPPTYAPAAFALGITFIFWGLVATPIISLVGVILSVLALVSWIGDIRNERRKR